MPKTRSRLLLAIAWAAIACAGAGPAAAATFLAGNERGDRALLYEVLNQRSRPLFAGAAGPGEALGAPAAISGPTYPTGEQLALDEQGGAVAIWNRVGDSTGPILVAQRSPGAAFGQATQLSPGHNSLYAILAVNSGGDAIVAWEREGQVAQYAFRPAGGSFGRPGTLPTKGNLIGAAVDPDGGVMVLWHDAIGNDDVFRYAYRPPGGDFGSPTSLGAPRNVGFGTTAFASATNGRAMLAWREGRAIRAIERPPGGAFGASPDVAQGVPPDTLLGSMSLAPSGAAAVSYGETPVEVATRAAGSPFGAPASLGNGSRPQVAVNSRGDAAAIWSGPDLAVFGSFNPAGGGWGPRLAVAPARPFAPGTFTGASLSLDGGGTATAAWEESDGAFVRPYTREFSAQGMASRRQLARLRSFTRERPASACSPRRGRVIRRTSRSTVFVSEHGVDKGSRYACLLARGAPVGIDDFDGIYPPIRLAGPFVAYASDSCDPDACDTDVRVTDLRDESDGVNRTAFAHPTTNAEVPALVLSPGGGVAWMSCSSKFGPAYGKVDEFCRTPGSQRKRLYALGRRDLRPRLLARGRKLDPSSLALHGARLSWRDGRARRSARLH